MIGRFRKNRILKSYFSKLPGLLKKDYGRLDSYTVGQVRSSVERHGLNKKYLDYAYAIFCQEGNFVTKTAGDEIKYEEIRREIADHYFHGDVGFSLTDVGGSLEGGSDAGFSDD